MIDFYGGPGTYASWPERVRAYAVETTPVNILDWASAYGFPLPVASLAAVAIPTPCHVGWREPSRRATGQCAPLRVHGRRYACSH